jgi:hypothetical protein
MKLRSVFSGAHNLKNVILWDRIKKFGRILQFQKTNLMIILRMVTSYLSEVIKVKCCEINRGF